MDLGPGKPSAFTLTWVLGHSSHGPSLASSSPCAPAGTPAWQGSSSVPEMLTHFLRRAEGNCADRALRCHTPPAWLSVCFCSLRRCDAVQQQPCAEWGQTAPRVACPRPSGAHRQLQHRSSSGWYPASKLSEVTVCTMTRLPLLPGKVLLALFVSDPPARPQNQAPAPSRCL